MISLPIPICPITQDTITNAYIDKEGNTYEKDAIIKWVEINKTSPITRNTLLLSDLSPNRAINNIIQSNKTTITSQNNNNVDKQYDKCRKCDKVLKVSTAYKGKKKPLCYSCRPWECKVCTYINESLHDICGICETHK